MRRRILPPPASQVKIRYVPLTAAREPRARRAIELLMRLGSTPAAPRILVLCIALTTHLLTAEDYEPLRIDALASVGTYHFHRNGQNEVNPGWGVNIGLNEGAWTPGVGGLVYDDSADHVAWMAGANLRYDFSPYVAVKLGAGYAHFTAYQGFAVVPTFLAGSERIKGGVSLIGLRAIGFTMEVRL